MVEMRNKRIGYIDALRGFAMFLVVYAHVLNLGIGLPLRSSVTGDFIALFHMPLFFYISGIVAYKSFDNWNGNKLRDGAVIKALQLLIPTLIVMTVYQCVRHGTITGFADGPGRYWFTYCLFIFFAIYYLIIALCKLIKKPWAEQMLMLTGLLAFAAIYMYHPHGVVANWLQWENFATNLQFFATGLLCRKYGRIFQRFVASDAARTALIAIGVALYVCHRWLLLGTGLAEKVNSGFVLRYVFILVAFLSFVRYRDFFDGDNVVARTLRLVGRRTLDIYLLHFFFVIGGLVFLKPLLENNARPLVEIAICSATASIIIAVTLMLSKLLRMSNFVGKYVLGTPNERTEVGNWW